MIFLIVFLSFFICTLCSAMQSNEERSAEIQHGCEQVQKSIIKLAQIDSPTVGEVERMQSFLGVLRTCVMRREIISQGLPLTNEQKEKISLADQCFLAGLSDMLWIDADSSHIKNPKCVLPQKNK